MPYWSLSYHLVWATKNREPLIIESAVPSLYEYLRGKGNSLGGIVHAVGGTSDHIHVVASIRPGLAVAGFIGSLKGASAHWMNHVYESPVQFAWQAEYGAFSLDEGSVPAVIRYVLDQPARHAANRIVARFERATN